MNIMLKADEIKPMRMYGVRWRVLNDALIVMPLHVRKCEHPGHVGYVADVLCDTPDVFDHDPAKCRGHVYEISMS